MDSLPMCIDGRVQGCEDSLGCHEPGHEVSNRGANLMFRRGLNETGFVEDQNATIEYRWAEGRFDRLPALAIELVQHNATVITATGGPPSALAAKAATSTIPIVFNIASDPIKLGLVASLNYPGGNATGVNLFSVAVEPKKLEFLHELVPKAQIIGVFVNPRNSNARLS